MNPDISISIHYAFQFLKKYPDTNVIILSPSEMQNCEIKNIEKRMNKSISFISYTQKNELEIDPLRKYLFIINEIHQFMQNVVFSNKSSIKPKNDIGIMFEIIRKHYDKYVIGLSFSNPGFQFILNTNKFESFNSMNDPHLKIRNTSQSPKVGDSMDVLHHKFPFELIPFFNLEIRPSSTLKGNHMRIFPETIEEFTNMYIDVLKNKLKNVDDLKEKLKGLISYRELKTNVKIEKSIIEVEMTETQYKQYIINQYLNSKSNHFEKLKQSKSIPETSKHKTSIESPTLDYQLSLAFQGKLTNQSLIKKVVKKSDKYELSISTPLFKIPESNDEYTKLMKMIEDTKNINGPCIFYISDPEFAIVMNKELDSKNLFEDENNLKIFNSKDNRYGKLMKYLILTSPPKKYLKNVRYLGIGTVDPDYSNIEHIINSIHYVGSHDDLKPNERTVIQKIYLNVKNSKYYSQHSSEINKICCQMNYSEKGLCADELIYRDSIYNNTINNEFVKLMKSISID